MLSLEITGAKTFRCIQQEIPQPDENQVLLRILQCGICGSDVQIYHGLHPAARFPLIMGHECAAEIASIGAGVEGFSEGELVTVQPQITCGICRSCRRGIPNVCRSMKFMGVHVNGFFTEYALVPAGNLRKVRAGVDRDSVMVAEPVAVAVHASRRAGITPGTRAVVVGAGAIGNLTAQACRQFGAEVLITDIQEQKLRIAEACGIDYCCNTSSRSLGEVISDKYGEDGADVIIDCAAAAPVFPEMLKCASSGTKVVVVGNYKRPVEVEMNQLQRRELEICGVMQYNRPDFEDALELLNAQKIHVSEIITTHFRLAELGKAFQYIDEHPETMKIAVDCDESEGRCQ